jgi:hypothetical protein
VTIYAIPRGHRFNQQTGIIEGPDGESAPTLQEIKPYEPTENWTALPPPAAAPSVMNAETAAAIEVELPDDPKITRLNPYRRRDDDAPGVA